jgi:non-specific serine/threonine protein kinase
VAVLIARGLSNREIADELVVTKRTAETHIERIFAKLGLHSRLQLARWAFDEAARSSSPT